MRLIPIYTWTKGIRNFDHRRKQFSQLPWAQGVLLLCCVVVAMLLANLPFTKEFYHNAIDHHIIPKLGSVKLEKLTMLQIQQFYNELLKNEPLTS